MINQIILITTTLIQLYTYDPTNYTKVLECRVRGGNVIVVDGKLVCISKFPVFVESK